MVDYKYEYQELHSMVDYKYEYWEPYSVVDYKYEYLEPYCNGGLKIECWEFISGGLQILILVVPPSEDKTSGTTFITLQSTFLVQLNIFYYVFALLALMHY